MPVPTDFVSALLRSASCRTDAHAGGKPMAHAFAANDTELIGAKKHADVAPGMAPALKAVLIWQRNVWFGNACQSVTLNFVN